MKKITGLLLAIIVLSAFFAVPAFAEESIFSVESVSFYDAEGSVAFNENITTYNPDFGNITGREYQKVKITGWYGAAKEIKDIGWSNNGGDITWGCMDTRTDLSKTSTGCECYTGYKLEADIIKADSVSLKIYAKFSDSEEPVYEFTYINKTAGISADRPYLVIDEDKNVIYPLNFYAVSENANEKDWIGFYLLSDVNLEVFDDSLETQYWWYTAQNNGSTEFEFPVYFKWDGAEDLKEQTYVAILFSDDGYDIIDYVTFEVFEIENTANAASFTQFNPVEDTKLTYNYEKGSYQVNVSGTVSLDISRMDPNNYRYGVLKLECDETAGTLTVTDNGSKLADVCKLVKGSNKYGFTVDGSVTSPTFKIEGAGGNVVLKSVVFFSTYEEYMDYIESNVIWTGNKELTPTEAPTDTPEPTEVPTDTPVPEDEPTEAPADPTDVTGEEKDTEKKTGSNLPVIIGVAAGILVVAAAVVVIIIKAKKGNK